MNPSPYRIPAPPPKPAPHRNSVVGVTLVTAFVAVALAAAYVTLAPRPVAYGAQAMQSHEVAWYFDRANEGVMRRAEQIIPAKAPTRRELAASQPAWSERSGLADDPARLPAASSVRASVYGGSPAVSHAPMMRIGTGATARGAWAGPVAYDTRILHSTAAPSHMSFGKAHP